MRDELPSLGLIIQQGVIGKNVWLGQVISYLKLGCYDHQPCRQILKMNLFYFFRKQIIAASALLALQATASADVLRDYLWTNRVIVTFSENESVPERLLLIKQIQQYPCDYMRRDLVHVDLIAGSNDYKILSQRFSLSDKEFKLVLVGKDGKTKLYTRAAALEDIFALTDTMPMRKKEMRGEKCK